MHKTGRKNICILFVVRKISCELEYASKSVYASTSLNEEYIKIG